MIKVNEADGKTQETPIVILQAEDDREGWIYIYKFLDYYQEYHRYDRHYRREDVGDTMDQFLSVFRFYKDGNVVDELWIDWTTLFHVWDK
jgi:hypothetical protein